MPPPETKPIQNRFLAALPPKDFKRLEPKLEAVSLTVRQSVCEPGEPIRHVYFPTTGIVSLVTVMSGEAAVEIATVGREGLAGLPVFLESDDMPGRAFCQVPGDALRMDAEAFRQEARRGGGLTKLLLRYTQGLFNQVSQNAACSRTHSIEERCARWLLMCQDRVGQDQFLLTQEFLGQMLGVRRATVNVAAGILQNAGFISYTRGRITILNRPGLESAACECYAIIAAEADRVLGPA